MLCVPSSKTQHKTNRSYTSSDIKEIFYSK